MKLKLKEIKYIEQSLQYRAEYYKDKPQYKQYYKELQPIIKKFIKIQGKDYFDLKKVRKLVGKIDI